MELQRGPTQLPTYLSSNNHVHSRKSLSFKFFMWFGSSDEAEDSRGRLQPEKLLSNYSQKEEIKIKEFLFQGPLCGFIWWRSRFGKLKFQLQFFPLREILRLSTTEEFLRLWTLPVSDSTPPIRGVSEFIFPKNLESKFFPLSGFQKCC